MLPTPPRPRSNVAGIVVLGFFAGGVTEFVLDLILDFTVKTPSLATIDAISVVLALVIGAVVGGVMFLSRPRHYGVVPAVGVSALVSATIGDQLALFVFLTLKHLPVSAEIFTGYFTHARASLWISDGIVVALAAGLTALRVGRVRAREAGAPAGNGMPPQHWAQSPPPVTPWAQPPYGGPSPQGPYGPPPAPGSPPGPYGPPPGSPPGPYGPPPAPGPWPGPPPSPGGPPA